MFGKELTEFLKQVIALRKNSPHFHAITPFKKSDYLYCGYPDLSIHGTKAWYPDYSNYSRAFAVMIAGRYFEKMLTGKKKGRSPVKRIGNYYVIFNLFWQAQDFDLPALKNDHCWKLELASCDDKNMEEYIAEKRFHVPARSIVVLKESEKPQTTPELTEQ